MIPRVHEFAYGAGLLHGLDDPRLQRVAALLRLLAGVRLEDTRRWPPPTTDDLALAADYLRGRLAVDVVVQWLDDGAPI